MSKKSKIKLLEDQLEVARDALEVAVVLLNKNIDRISAAEREESDGKAQIKESYSNLPPLEWPTDDMHLIDTSPPQCKPDVVGVDEKQIGGDHYKLLGSMQPWDVMQAWFTPEEYRGWQKGSAIVYLARERSKGGDQDIRKAAHHLEKLIAVTSESNKTKI